MRVAVTGAAGFLGSHLCERLVADGHEVVGIDSFTRFYARTLKERNVAALRATPGFRLTEADAGAVALGGCDAVVHLAARPGVRSGSPELFERANVRLTDAVARSGVPRVVLASSSSVYSPSGAPVAEDAPLAPRSDYGRSKLRAERVAERAAAESGVEVVTLRYFTLYGPRQRPDMAFSRFALAALGGPPAPLIGDGGQTRDFTFVEDAVDATVRALAFGRAGAVYNVGGGAPATLDEALALVAEAIGTRPALIRRPADPREPRSTAADISRARAELGWLPRVPLPEGIGRQMASAGAAYTLEA